MPFTSRDVLKGGEGWKKGNIKVRFCGIKDTAQFTALLRSISFATGVLVFALEIARENCKLPPLSPLTHRVIIRGVFRTFTHPPPSTRTDLTDHPDYQKN